MTEASLHKQKRDNFHVVLNAKGQYKIKVDNQMWLQSSPTFFIVENKIHRSDDGSLKLLHISTDHGFDKLGPRNLTSLYYQALGTKTKVKLMFRWYRDLPLVLFGQVNLLKYLNSA